MGFKTGLVVGLGIGYVLGTRAGERQFEQLRSTWGKVTDSPSIQRARDMATEGTRKGMDAVQEQLDRAGSAVKDRLHRDEASDLIVDLTDSASDAADSAREGLEGAAGDVKKAASDLAEAATDAAEAATKP